MFMSQVVRFGIFLPNQVVVMDGVSWLTTFGAKTPIPGLAPWFSSTRLLNTNVLSKSSDGSRHFVHRSFRS